MTRSRMALEEHHVAKLLICELRDKPGDDPFDASSRSAESVKPLSKKRNRVLPLPDSDLDPNAGENYELRKFQAKERRARVNISAECWAAPILARPNGARNGKRVRHRLACLRHY